MLLWHEASRQPPWPMADGGHGSVYVRLITQSCHDAPPIPSSCKCPPFRLKSTSKRLHSTPTFAHAVHSHHGVFTKRSWLRRCPNGSRPCSGDNSHLANGAAGWPSAAMSLLSNSMHGVCHSPSCLSLFHGACTLTAYPGLYTLSPMALAT